MIFNSMRGRLLAWFGLLLALVVAGFGFTAYHLQAAQHYRRIDQELQQRVALMISYSRGGLPGFVRGGGRFNPFRSTNLPLSPMLPEQRPEFRFETRIPPEVESQFGDQNPGGYYYSVWNREGGLVVRSTNAPADLTLPARASQNASQPPRMRGGLREAVYFTPGMRAIVVGRPIEEDLLELRKLAWLLTLAGCAILGLSVAGGWWITTRAMRPIEDISRTAAKIADGDLAQRINEESTDSEISRLVGVLNSTFSRLEASFAQQARFTADAAHELRTPVAVMLTHTANGLDTGVTPEERQTALAACQRAAERMRSLIDSLLLLARMDAGQEAMRRERCDLSRLAEDAVELIRPLAARNALVLSAQVQAVPVEVDANRISQVIANLLSNAIYYNHERGEVRLRVNSNQGHAELRVYNTGPGISSADLPHVFERFYRAEKSRAGGVTGRSGLGLSISKAIVVAHGGDIFVTSTPGEGTEFTVRLPSAPG